MGSVYLFSVKVSLFSFFLASKTHSGFLLSKTLFFNFVRVIFLSSALESVVRASEKTSVAAWTVELADPTGGSFRA